MELEEELAQFYGVHLHEWRQPMPGGHAMLLDPATGQVLDPRRPHRQLQRDDRLAEGYEYLAARGSSLHLSIVYASHEDAADLGTGDWFERKMAHCDAFAFESISWARDEYRRIYEKMLGGATLSRVAPQLDDGFTRRWMHAAAQKAKPTFSYDVESTPQEIDQLIIGRISLWQLDYEYLSDADYIDAMVVDQAMREWYMVGKFGYELKRSPIGYRDKQSVLLAAGAAHLDLIRKFRLFETAVEPLTPPDVEVEDEIRTWRQQIAGVLATSIIPAFLRDSQPAT